MPAYATRAELDGYAGARPGGVDDATADRELDNASRDVDRLIGGSWRVRQASGTYAGLIYDPTTVPEPFLTMLKRATMAQAEFRILNPDAIAGTAAGGSVKGPDFEVTLPSNETGQAPRIGAKTADELAPFPRRLTARGVA